MFRKQFVDIITDTGMVTLKELRPLLNNVDEEEVTEFKLMEFPGFDDLRFARAVSEKYGMTYIELSKARVQDDVINLIKKSQAVRYRIIPITKSAKSITLATYDPSIRDKINDIRTMLRHPVDIILTNLKSWEILFDRIKISLDELVDTVQEIKAMTGGPEDIVKEEDIGSDVVSYVNKFLADSFIRKASDIHIEPYEKNFRIRFRIDGVLMEVANPPRKMMLPLISRVKIMAQMDIAERRKPQDGRIKLSVGGKAIDYRVSSLPTLFGEKIVLRLLDSSNLQLDMTKLGFEPKQLKVFMQAIKSPYGMCLVTGPTGSGKTTTLYSALAELNKITSNISTAEDPVEFNLEGINQVNVKKDIGLTFATALKAFLRQDPDIIMVGEIRDQETGEIAVEAALTGHLVLSTLHTNDAPSTVTRLLNMGVEPFLVNSALNVVVAQRLCRKICQNCKDVQNIDKEELVACGIAPSSAENLKVYYGTGCASCNETGYKGRVAIYEVMDVTPKIRELIMKEASSDEIKLMAIKEGMKTLRMTALTKVAQGLTTLEEAVKNSASDKL